MILNKLKDSESKTLLFELTKLCENLRSYV